MNGWILCSCGGHAFDRCCSCWAPICAEHATLADEKKRVTLKKRVVEIDLHTCPECTAQRVEAAGHLEVAA